MYFFYVPGISGNLGIGFPHSEPFQARVRFPQCLFGHRDPAFVWGFVANLLLLPGFCLVWFYPAFCLGFRSSYFATAGILFGLVLPILAVCTLTHTYKLLYYLIRVLDIPYTSLRLYMDCHGMYDRLVLEVDGTSRDISGSPAAMGPTIAQCAYLHCAISDWFKYSMYLN